MGSTGGTGDPNLIHTKPSQTALCYPVSGCWGPEWSTLGLHGAGLRCPADSTTSRASLWHVVVMRPKGSSKQMTGDSLCTLMGETRIYKWMVWGLAGSPSEKFPCRLEMLQYFFGELRQHISHFHTWGIANSCSNALGGGIKSTTAGSKLQSLLT